MVSHDQLIENWLTDNYNPDLKSETVGNSIQIQEKTCNQTGEEYTALLGYGHAVYSIKVEDTVFLFTGWNGRSTTTSKHLTQIENKVNKEIGVDLVKVTGTQGDSKLRPQHLSTPNLLTLIGEDNLEQLPKHVQQEITATAL